MKASLQLGMHQQLTLTPQLQQAIRLLQLSTLELQLEVQQTLEANPMLELDEPELEGEDNETLVNAEYESASVERVMQETTDTQLSHDLLPNELPIDSQWEDTFQSTLSSGNSSSEEYPTWEQRATVQGNLHDHLQWQLDLTPFSDRDRALATAILDAIDEDGFLKSSLEDIQTSLGELEEAVDREEVEAVLCRLQQFDPVGVAARDLQECLLIQLKQLPKTTKWRSEAIEVIEHYLDLLGARDYPRLLRQTKWSREDLNAVLQLILSLNPRPGSKIIAEESQYIVPDVLVRKESQRWVVELNSEAIPRLRINRHYAGLVQRAHNTRENNFLRDNLQEARWFLKSLQSRNETLLKVASCIVKHQRNFLEYGPEAMKPLILHDVAVDVGMHESTISRVTTQKFLHTPQGVFELKYFFSSHVNTSTGGECSSTAIRALIKKLVAAENASKPLSDNRIASLLGQQGINVARRTVAKYRESMAIPPSNERKCLARE